MPSLLDPQKTKHSSVTLGHILVYSFLVSLLVGATMLYGIWYMLESSNRAYEQSLSEMASPSSMESETGAVQKTEIEYAENEDETIASVEENRESVISIVVKKTVTVSPGVRMDPFNDPFFWMFGEPIQPIPAPEEESEEEREEIKQTVARGSGFIISDDGFILTNKHVVDIQDAEYEVILYDGSEHVATLLDTDPLNDIAVLKIEAADLNPVELGDSDNLEIGQTVIAIGYSLGEYPNTVTKGVVSGIGRNISATSGMGGMVEQLEHIIQTDAAINPGNSGGPLINLEGQVIGINTAIDKAGQSIGFAIPINDAKYVAESIREHGEVIRPFVGVRYLIVNENLQELNDLPVSHGALIIRGETVDELAVVPGSPADIAGLQENDIILELNGEQINQEQTLIELLQKYKPGDEVTTKVYSKGEEKTINLTLGESNR